MEGRVVTSAHDVRPAEARLFLQEEEWRGLCFHAFYIILVRRTRLS